MINFAFGIENKNQQYNTNETKEEYHLY